MRNHVVGALGCSTGERRYASIRFNACSEYENYVVIARISVLSQLRPRFTKGREGSIHFDERRHFSPRPSVDATRCVRDREKWLGGFDADQSTTVNLRIARNLKSGVVPKKAHLGAGRPSVVKQRWLFGRRSGDPLCFEKIRQGDQHRRHGPAYVRDAFL
jgi:hypothetical protein